MLLVVLYGCETRSNTLTEEHKAENGVLRRIFVPTADEIAGD
jgi:hypothetical protein